MKRLLAALLVALAASGCTSPEICDDPLVKVLAAVPGLTYVDGDPEAGTTTILSLPLLTYRTSEQKGTRQTTSTYVLPLLGAFEQTDRRLEVVWSDAPQGPPQDGWWDHRRRVAPDRRPSPEPTSPEAEDDAPEPAAKPRARVTPGVSAPRRGAASSSEARRAPRATPRPRSGVTRGGAPPRRVRPRQEPEARPTAARGEVKAVTRDDRLVLHLEGVGEVERLLPQQHTSWDVLFPLLKLEIERPAVAVVRHGGAKGGRALYQVGRTRDAFRLLPLFSYASDAERTSFTFWPLFSGYERDETGSYLRLFWFIKIPLGGPEE